MFLQLAFKAFEQSNGVGGRSRETGDDFIVVQAASFARGVFHHVIAHGHLSVGDERHFAVSAHAQNSSSVHPRGPL